jgi:type IV pilus assembly protein PilW
MRRRTVRSGDQAGVTLVDVMVGLVIALLTIVVVYEAFVVTQAVRRNAGAAADMQANGAFALSTLATQAANAGAGIASAARWLDGCPAVADIATTLRPIDVLITDGGAPDRPDSLVVRQSLAHTSAAPAPFVAAASAGSDFHVGAVDGFAAGDRVIAISRTGHCASAIITAVSNGAAGVLDIAHTPVIVDLPVTSLLLNLGEAPRASTLRFDLASGSLRSTDVSNGDAPNPLVSNLANLKFQYGIDSDGDGVLDTWVTASDTGSWSPATLLAAPRSTLERIKALRIGLIARTERTERTRTGAFHWVLFDCEHEDKSACAGRLEGTFAGSPSGGYRYRVYETVVPLRNTTWNRAT